MPARLPDRPPIRKSARKPLRGGYDPALEWWEHDGDDEIAVALKATFGRVQNESMYRIAALKRWRQAYEDRANHLVSKTSAGLKRLCYNLTRSISETVCSKLAKETPRVTFVPHGGDYDLRQRCEELGQWTDGVMDYVGFHHEYQLAFKDSTWADVGAVFFSREKKSILVQRAKPWDLWVDLAESAAGMPRTLFYRRFFDRAELIARFPDVEDEIRAAPPAVIHMWPTSRAVKSRVEVIEAWHLPTLNEKERELAPKADHQGRHVLILADGTHLLDEPYVQDRYPFVFLYWDEPIDGFFGQGIAERQWGKQSTVNDMLQTIRVSQKHGAVLRWFIAKGSKIPPEFWTNDARVQQIEYAGRIPPTPISPPILAPEVYQFLESTKRAAYEEEGVSQFDASGLKPAGVDSAVAQREYQDITSGRLILPGQRYERAVIDGTRILLSLAKELADVDGVDLEVTAKQKAYGGIVTQRIKWSDIDLEADRWAIDMFPTSQLPKTPQGKLQTLMEMAKLPGEDGRPMVPSEVIMELMGIPDLDQASRVRLAPQRLAEMMVGRILRGDKPEPPEPQMDLKTALYIAGHEYCLAREQGCPRDRLSKLQAWMSQAIDLIKQAQPPAPPPPTGPMLPGPPGGPPAMPPPSPIPGAGPAMPSLHVA